MNLGNRERDRETNLNRCVDMFVQNSNPFSLCFLKDFYFGLFGSQFYRVHRARRSLTRYMNSIDLLVVSFRKESLFRSQI